MEEIDCENFLMAKMAEADGEKTRFAAGQIEAHLDFCKNCQSDLDEMQNIGDLFKKQTRSEANPNLWAAIEKRIDAQIVSKVNLKPFIFIGVLLFIYKLLEIFSERDLGWEFKVIPLIFVAVLFALIKENPFKINAELTLER
jgi:hypothetical protein